MKALRYNLWFFGPAYIFPQAPSPVPRGGGREENSLGGKEKKEKVRSSLFAKKRKVIMDILTPYNIRRPFYLSPR